MYTHDKKSSDSFVAKRQWTHLNFLNISVRSELMYSGFQNNWKHLYFTQFVLSWWPYWIVQILPKRFNQQATLLSCGGKDLYYNVRCFQLTFISYKFLQLIDGIWHAFECVLRQYSRMHLPIVINHVIPKVISIISIWNKKWNN